jgi:TatD DNase family protein
MPMLVDTHCHLDAAEFDADRDDVAQAALKLGVGAIVIPAVETANFAHVTTLCRRYPGCAPAYGIHPLYVDRTAPEHLNTLRQAIETESPIAVGEIGLDFFAEGYDEKKQTHYFVEQLKIAREFDLPVILHVRRAVDTILKYLRQFRVKGGIAHAFNGSRQQADILIDLGFKLGFGGAMTYDRALKIRELAKTLPLTSIVLETDAPDIPPSWLEHRRNSPAELPQIGETLAALRGISFDSVATATTSNAIDVLPGLKGLCQA